MELEGPVEQGRIWGYVTSDDSLTPSRALVGTGVPLDGMRLSRCRKGRLVPPTSRPEKLPVQAHS